jgi:hypothetical protein
MACRKKASAKVPEKWVVVSRTTWRDDDGVSRWGESRLNVNFPKYELLYRRCMSRPG